MTGANKILTVSYGTFSCTLEGFDEPFNTMKAIAEYFRDLAADDRYFGAEPPQPDAEMLHRIAEREIQRRVEAKIQGNGVILRPSLDAPAGSAAHVAEAAPAPVETRVDVAPEAPTPAPAPAHEPAAVAPPQVAPAPVSAPAVSAPVSAPLSGHVESSVAAKLQRIREAVASARAAQGSEATAAPAPLASDAPVSVPPASDAFDEDLPASDLPNRDLPTGAQPAVAESRDTRPAAAPTGFGYDLDVSGPLASDEFAPEDDEAEDSLPPVATAAESAPEPVAEDEPAAEVEVEAEAQPETEASEPEAPAADATHPDPDEDAVLRALAERRASRRAERRAQRQARLDETPAEDDAGDGAEDNTVEDEATVETAPVAAQTEAPAETAEEIEDIADIVAASSQPEVLRMAAPEADESEAIEAAGAAEDTVADDLTDPEVAEEAAVFDSIAARLQEDAPADSAPVEAPAEEPAAEAPTEALAEAPAAQPQRPLIRARVIKLRRAEPRAEVAGEKPAASLPPETAAAAAAAILQPAETQKQLPKDAILSAEDEADLMAELALLDDGEEGAVAPEAPALDTGSQEDGLDLDALMASLSDEDIEEAPAAAAAPARDTTPAPQPEDAFDIDLTGLDLEDEPEEDAEDHAARLTETAAQAEPRSDVQAETEEAEAAPAQNMLTPSPQPIRRAEPDVSRLMQQADERLEGQDTKRRRSAIAHLKAAVAATVAERLARPNAERKDETGPYREDLDNAVRPRRPNVASLPGRTETAAPRPLAKPERPAPLVLVSEQRVDPQPEDAIDPRQLAIRPRRVSTAQIARSTQEAAQQMPPLSAEDATSFAQFAQSHGSHGLADLLEAAAAYTSQVEGRPHFSPPQIMKKIASVEDGTGFSREDQMRSFGKLLRQGKIAKIKRGQYAITEQSRFFDEQKRA